MTSNESNNKKTLHLVGIGVGHSIAPTMHNSITASLNLPWTFHATECPTLDSLMTLARDPATAGLVVTMPYKTAIMPHLDALDDLSVQIGAVNNVYRDPKDATKLRGTNTDWRGIVGSLLEKSPNNQPVLNKPALIVGAGGASRAATLPTYNSPQPGYRRTSPSCCTQNESASPVHRNRRPVRLSEPLRAHDSMYTILRRFCGAR